MSPARFLLNLDSWVRVCHESTVNIVYPVEHKISDVFEAEKRASKWTIDDRLKSLNEVTVQHVLKLPQFSRLWHQQESLYEISKVHRWYALLEQRPTREPLWTARHKDLRLDWVCQRYPLIFWWMDTRCLISHVYHFQLY